MKYSEIRRMNGRSASWRKYSKMPNQNPSRSVLEGFLVMVSYYISKWKLFNEFEVICMFLA